MTIAGVPDDTVPVHWQTGCTSCLRTMDFLEVHGVPCRSRNVLPDGSALDDLARFGLARPITACRRPGCRHATGWRPMAPMSAAASTTGSQPMAAPPTGLRLRAWYGTRTLDGRRDRTTWRSGRHARQTVWLLERRGIAPLRRLGAETFRGLPMPEGIRDTADAVA